MADKLAGGVKSGTIGYSTDVVLRSATDNTEMSGKVAADITATYWRPGEFPVPIVLVDLTTLVDAWTSGGVKEASATTMKGTYRLDVPDTAFSAGPDWVEINVSCAGSFVFKERFALETVGAAELAPTITAINAKTSQLTFTTPNVVDASGGATAQAVADAVLATVMTEGYAADGSPATIAQALYMLLQHMSERSVSGTTMTVNKLDGTTVAMTFTLNSSVNPTSITRTT